MWQAQITALRTHVHQYQLLQDGAVLSFADYLQLLQSSADFARHFSQLLAASPFVGFFWEVKPTTASGLTDELVFVLVENKRLPLLTADPTDFQNYLDPTQLVVNFANLRGDAQLVVPTSQDRRVEYTHLAAFVRTAGGGSTHRFLGSSRSRLHPGARHSTQMAKHLRPGRELAARTH